MRKTRQTPLILAVPLMVLWLAARAGAQEMPPSPAMPAPAHPARVRLTIEEARQRALTQNKLLNLASMNAHSKEYVIRAAQSDYFPKVSGTALYLHFNDDLGKVLTTQGRTFTGPRGTPLLTFPPTTIEAAVVNQDTSLALVTAVQPITDLLKVRQGVLIARADQQIAQAQFEKGARELASGVSQLYWGILFALRIRAGAVEAVRGSELLAKTGLVDARIALAEAQQALQQVDRQILDLQEQLCGLLELPLCTTLELIEPTLPTLSYHCAGDVAALAVAASPEVREAEATIAKAEAALKAGKLDYVPSVAVMGGYANQTAADYIQPNIGFVGVVASYTFIDWGKRKNVIRERDELVMMARLKLEQTREQVEQKASKAFRDLGETQTAQKAAQQLVALRKEAVKQAMPQAQKDPITLIKASKDLMLAEVEAIKAELAYRQAVVVVQSLVEAH
jgi:outer membrane protein TolC